MPGEPRGGELGGGNNIGKEFGDWKVLLETNDELDGNDREANEIFIRTKRDRLIQMIESLGAAAAGPYQTLLQELLAHRVAEESRAKDKTAAPAQAVPEINHPPERHYKEAERAVNTQIAELIGEALEQKGAAPLSIEIPYKANQQVGSLLDFTSSDVADPQIAAVTQSRKKRGGGFDDTITWKLLVGGSEIQFSGKQLLNFLLNLDVLAQKRSAFSTGVSPASELTVKLGTTVNSKQFVSQSDCAAVFGEHYRYLSEKHKLGGKGPTFIKDVEGNRMITKDQEQHDFVFYPEQAAKLLLEISGGEKTLDNEGKPIVWHLVQDYIAAVEAMAREYAEQLPLDSAVGRSAKKIQDKAGKRDAYRRMGFWESSQTVEGQPQLDSVSEAVKRKRLFEKTGIFAIRRALSEILQIPIEEPRP